VELHCKQCLHTVKHTAARDPRLRQRAHFVSVLSWLLQKSVRVRRRSHVDVSSSRNLSGGVCCLSDIGPSVFEIEEKESIQHIIWMLCLPCEAVQDHLLQKISPVLVDYEQ